MVNNEPYRCMRNNERYSINSTGTFPYQSTVGTMNNYPHLSHQYSSSQAQLQSLTSLDMATNGAASASVATMSNCDTLRKTPNFVRKPMSAHTNQRAHHLQQPQQRAHVSSSMASTTGTKPMTSLMMLNEPSFSVQPAAGRHHHHHDIQQHNNMNPNQNQNSLQQNYHPQHRSMSHPAALGTLAPGGAQNHLLLLPPPYSVEEHQLASSSSSTPSASNNQIQQNVICHQQTPSQTTTAALFSHATTNNVPQQQECAATPGSSRTITTSTTTIAAQPASSLTTTTTTTTTPTSASASASTSTTSQPAVTQQVQSSNRATLPFSFQASTNSSSHPHPSHQNQMLNPLNSGSGDHMQQQQQQQQQQQPFPPVNNVSALAQAQLSHHNNISSYLNHHHHHHSNAAELNFINNLNHFGGATHYINHHLNHSSKSKSCLTCADISIKWYIVVIALLGLICALIGTIVGAVHSAGRDYISLALLLIGVGLVLVAISWIALRITIKTYKTSSSSRNNSAISSTTPQTHGAHHRRHLRAPALPLPLSPPQIGTTPHALARLFGPTTSTTSSLHRALMNERLYMMAAAAAAAGSISRQSGAATMASSGGQPGVGSMGSNLQQETARSASRLSTSSSTSDEDIEQVSSTRETSNTSPNNNGILFSIKQRLPRRLARLIPYSNLQDNHQPVVGQSDASASTSRRRQAPPIAPLETPIPPPALAALFHQYSALLQPGHPTNFLFQPPAHLGFPFAFAMPGDTFNFRPPPPSYNASMQDTRLRMLMQDRANNINPLFSFSNNHAAQVVQQQPASSSSSSSTAIITSTNNTGTLTSTTELHSANSSPESTTHSDRSPHDRQATVVSASAEQMHNDITGCHEASNEDPLLQVPSTSQSHLGDIMKQQHKQEHQIQRPLRNKTSVQTRQARLKPSSSIPTLVNNDIYVSSSSTPPLSHSNSNSPCLVGEDRRRESVSASLSPTETTTSQTSPTTLQQSNKWVRNSTVVSIGSSAASYDINSTNSNNKTNEERYKERNSESKSKSKSKSKNKDQSSRSMNEYQARELKVLGYL